MLRSVLKHLGIGICYVCKWGKYEHRYSATDRAMNRPIHRDMSVAPPWAKRCFFRLEGSTHD